MFRLFFASVCASLEFSLVFHIMQISFLTPVSVLAYNVNMSVSALKTMLTNATCHKLIYFLQFI